MQGLPVSVQDVVQPVGDGQGGAGDPDKPCGIEAVFRQPIRMNQHALNDAVEGIDVRRKAGNRGGVARRIGHAVMIDPSVDVFHDPPPLLARAIGLAFAPILRHIPGRRQSPVIHTRGAFPTLSWV